MADEPSNKFFETNDKELYTEPVGSPELEQRQRDPADILDEHIRTTVRDPENREHGLPAEGPLNARQQAAYDRYKAMNRNSLVPALANTVGALPEAIEHLFR